MTKFERFSLIISIAALILGVISLVISGNSSNKSDMLQQEQLVIQRKQTDLQTNQNKFQETLTRPWLDVKIVKDITTGWFYKIVPDGNKMNIVLEFEIVNIGSSPAVEIETPTEANIKDTAFTNFHHKLKSENIILGQGQKYGYTITMEMQSGSQQEVDKLIEKYNSQDIGLQFTFIVMYKGLLSPQCDYKTKKTFQINKKTTSILANSEFK